MAHHPYILTLHAPLPTAYNQVGRIAAIPSEANGVVAPLMVHESQRSDVEGVDGALGCVNHSDWQALHIIHFVVI